MIPRRITSSSSGFLLSVPERGLFHRRSERYSALKSADSSFEKQLVNNGFVLVFLDDNPIDEDGIPECEKVSAGRVRDPVGDEAVLRVQIQKMYNRLDRLPVREQKIMNYRYGLISKEEKSISETAAYFHLTERHMHSIEENALGKLKDGMNDGKII